MPYKKPRDLLSTKEAADYMGVSYNIIVAWVKEGKLKHIRAGKSKKYLRFKKSWLNLDKMAEK